jgi:hypothetical protein
VTGCLELRRDGGKLPLRALALQWQWEVLGHQSAEQQIHVGDGELVCVGPAVGEGTRQGASALGSDGELRAVEAADRASAGGDRG